MKVLDRTAIVVFTVCLLLCSLALPVFIIASSDSYYLNRFEESGLYSSEYAKPVRYINGDPRSVAVFNDEQIETITNHIIGFLFGSNNDFSLKLDNVILNGTVQDDVSVFGEEAVTHMYDVKILLKTILILSIILFIVLSASAAWLIHRRKNVSRILLKWSLVPIVCLAVFVLVFFFWVSIRSLESGSAFSADGILTEMWMCLHYIFFPFNPDKANGSFFNDTLTMILTLDFFMQAVLFTVLTAVIVMCIWLSTAKYLSSPRGNTVKHSPDNKTLKQN